MLKSFFTKSSVAIEGVVLNQGNTVCYTHAAVCECFIRVSQSLFELHNRVRGVVYRV